MTGEIGPMLATCKDITAYNIGFYAKWYEGFNMLL